VTAVAGLVLAAGAGSRLGRPKALLSDADGTSWVARAVDALRSGGCATVHVVIGAAASEVGPRVPASAVVVVADDWAEGMGASLRAGLTAVAAENPAAQAVIVMLVDTPGVTREVVSRLLEKVETDSAHRLERGRVAAALARSSYQGRLGHPVLIGRDHWDGVTATARGDRGARDYLSAHAVSVIECGDIGSGDDIDTATALERWLGD
jgi:CTP:molybdopterin cytidylyltransferase MocA